VASFAVDGPEQIGRQIDRPPKALDVSMESLVMRKPVGNSEISKKLWRTDPNVSKGGSVSCRDRSSAGRLDGAANQRTDRSSPEGSQFFNGEPCMRNRLQIRFWGLHLDADGNFPIVAALLIVFVFALLLALRF
jgi:hypothetical protein